MRLSPDPLAHLSAAVRPRVRFALRILLEAYESAANSKRDPWDLAVGIADLRAAGARVNDLRRLVGIGYVQHAIEKTKRGDKQRVFGKAGVLRFSKRSCFVLTQAGVGAARAPVWDGANHNLFWRKELLHHFRGDAPYQEAVLHQFEAEGWFRCVTLILPAEPGVISKVRLHNTIQNLNRIVRPHLRFRQEGGGSRVCWEALDG